MCSNTLEFGEKIIGLRYKEREAVYGLLKDVHDRIGVILTPRGYFLPGGGIENNETAIDCLKREFIEETGLTIDTYEYFGTAIHYGITPTDECLKTTGHFYKVTICEFDKLDAIEADHQFIWIDRLEALEGMKLEHQKWAIENIEEAGW